MAAPTTILITGASSGFGKVTAAHLAAKGVRVVGTSRRASWPEDATANPILIPMDVCDDTSVEEGLAWIREHVGAVDVLLNNAGIGIAGAVEDLTPDEAKAQFETNFFGMHRLIRGLLPTMRERGSGKIINVGSIAGEIAIPFQGFYSASKAATHALTAALRMELRGTGVQATVIEPGDFRTGFTDARQYAAAWEASAYQARAQTAVDVMAHDEQNGCDPMRFARLVERLVRADRLKPIYVTGPAPQKLARILRNILPAGLFERIIAGYYKT